MISIFRGVSVLTLGVMFTLVVTGSAMAQVEDDEAGVTEYDTFTLDEVYGIGPDSGQSNEADISLTLNSARGTFNGAANVAAMGATVAYSPAECIGSTDAPHASVYQQIPGYIGKDSVSVHARTRCKAVVQQVTVQTTIKRERWYGLETVMTSPVQKLSNNTWSGTASPHWMCAGEGTYTYRAYSTHTSLEGGKLYTASSANYGDPISRFAC